MSGEPWNTADRAFCGRGYAAKRPLTCAGKGTTVPFPASGGDGSGQSPGGGSRDESLAGPQGGALSPRRAYTIPLFNSDRPPCSWCRFEHGWVHYFNCAKNVNRVGEKRQCLFATICSYCFSRFPGAVFLPRPFHRSLYTTFCCLEQLYCLQ